MKYNPKINEDMAALDDFTQIHPLQPEHTVQGCLEVIKTAENYLSEITGMDHMTFQPAAGAPVSYTHLDVYKRQGVQFPFLFHSLYGGRSMNIHSAFL